MPYAFVQSQNNDGDGTIVTIYPITMSFAFGAGNGAVAFAHQGDSARAFPTCTDNKGNTYLEQTGARVTDSVNNNRTTAFVALGLSGSGAATVTLSWGGTLTVPFPALIVAEYSGIASALGGIGQNQGGIGSGNDLILSGNINFTSQPGVLVGASWEDSSGSFVPVGGGVFNDRSPTPVSGAQAYNFEDRRVTLTGNAQASFTNNSGVPSNYNTMAVGLLESGVTAVALQSSAVARLIRKERGRFDSIRMPFVQAALPVDNTPQPSGGVNVAPNVKADTIRLALYHHAPFWRQALSGQAATAPSTATFSYTGSGGLTFAGGSTIKITAAYPASGGLIFAGAAALKETFKYLASGGLVFAGSATFKETFKYLPSGGLVFGGAATYHTTAAPGTTGLLQFGGAAVIKATRAYVAGGLLQFGGAATIVVNLAQTYSYAGSGGLTFASAAALKETFKYLPSGGVQYGGSAGVVANLPTIYRYTAAGGMQLGGAATTSGPSVIITALNGGGGINTFRGRKKPKPEPHVFTYVGSGGAISFAGDADVSAELIPFKTYAYTGSGGALKLDGHAALAWHRRIDAEDAEYTAWQAGAPVTPVPPHRWVT